MRSVEELIRRQRILADFGDFSQESEDLDAVLTEACKLIGAALGTNLAKVLEIEEASATLLVRAGIGWQPGVVGEVRLEMSDHSSETYAIREEIPVITADIDQEDRFEFPAFMKEAAVVGVINVPIYLYARKPYGLLQVDSRDAWNPDDHDIEFLRTYATILGPVIDRLHKLHALREATDKNRTLLHELQHRIKNNIASIMGLVSLRIRHAASDEVRAELGVVGERIEVLRLVHDHVHATGDGDRLPLKPYVEQLLGGLLKLHCETAVRLDVQIGNIVIGSDAAIPFGLILNEFTTNSLKYAFRDNDRMASASILMQVEERDRRLWIRIQDNGRGLAAKPRSEGTASGTGMKLITALSRQIGGEPTWSSEPGATLCLDFPAGT